MTDEALPQLWRLHERFLLRTTSLFCMQYKCIHRVLKDLFITVKINDIKDIPERMVFVAVPACGDCHHCRLVPGLCFL